MISVLFTVTPDLTAEFPALAARKLGFHAVPLMCATEIPVPGAMPRVVRLMAHVDTDRPRSEIQHVYLRGAAGAPPGHRPVTTLPGGRCSSSATGLIGTSVALALRETRHRGLADATPTRRPPGSPPTSAPGRWCRTCATAKGIADVAVLAMPPAAGRRGRSRTRRTARSPTGYTDVASVKVLPVAQARDLGCDLSSYVPGHPLAGRERHGPGRRRRPTCSSAGPGRCARCPRPRLTRSTR